MIWYQIVGIIIPVLAFLAVIVKNLKWKRVIENSNVVMAEVRKALTDGVISKSEFLEIVAKALDAFIR